MSWMDKIRGSRLKAKDPETRHEAPEERPKTPAKPPAKPGTVLSEEYEHALRAAKIGYLSPRGIDPKPPVPKPVTRKPRAPKEAVIETKVCRYARDKGFLAYKFSSPNRRSVPDRMFVSPCGFVFFVEFKRPGGKTTEGQEREIQRLKDHNVLVRVIDNSDDGIELIDWILSLEIHS